MSDLLLVDSWYIETVQSVATDFDRLLEERLSAPICRFVKNNRFARGLSLYWYGRKFSFVALNVSQPGAWIFVFLDAVLGTRRRRVMLLEFIQRHRADGLCRRVLNVVWLRLIGRPIFQRVIARVHVLTEWERDHYANVYCLSVERFYFVPWYLRKTQDPTPVFERCSNSPHQLVVCSGRNACDWETVFKAANGAMWHLRVICGDKDLDRVRRLNEDGKVEILSEISREEHQRHLEVADLYILSLREQDHSSGHIRISNAIRAGAPIVAAAVKGIQGYIVDGETAMLVPPGDPGALRLTVDRLLADRQERIRLASHAFDRACYQTREVFLGQIRRFLLAGTSQSSETAGKAS